MSADKKYMIVSVYTHKLNLRNVAFPSVHDNGGLLCMLHACDCSLEQYKTLGKRHVVLRSRNTHILKPAPQHIRPYMV